MVSFTAFASAISMALLATTINAVPTTIAARGPPPTSSVIDLSLYKTTQPGSENQCWWWVGQGHVPPSDFTAANGASRSSCYKGDFYNLKIDHVATGYDCSVKVYSDDSCSETNDVGFVSYNTSSSDCKFPSSSGLVNLKSWKVYCQ